MAKPILPTLDTKKLDRETVIAIKRLHGYTGELEGLMNKLQAQIDALPPILSLDDIKAELSKTGSAPIVPESTGALPTTPTPPPDPGVPSGGGVTSAPSDWTSPPIPTGLRHIKAGFCNETDSTGMVVFDPAYCGLAGPKRSEWLARKVSAGYTHFILAPIFSYPVGGMPTFDLSGAPATFRGYINEVTGAGLTPIIFLSTGDGGSFETAVGHLDGSGNLTPDGYWTSFIPALADLTPQCLWVPGWELVRGGWTSLQFSVGVQRMATLLQPNALMYAHLSAERGSFASNPVEPNDPWQGNEQGCWKSAGGELLTGLLYQAPNEATHPGKLFDPAHPWFDRWYEIMVRAGKGGIGWRPIDVIWFEAGAYEYIRGLRTAAELHTVRLYAETLGPAGFGCG